MVKRHRSKNWMKIKDPYSIIRRRERDKCYEQKPADDAEENQRVPRALKNLLRVSNGLTGGQKRRAKKKTNAGRFSTARLVENVTPAVGMTRAMKPVPVFQQLANESDAKFAKRVEKLAKECVQECRFEDKYGVDVVRDSVTGQTRLVRRPNDRTNAAASSSGTAKKKRQRVQVDADGSERLVPCDKRQRQRVNKAHKASDKLDEFAHLKDTVTFGEVVQQPPSLPPSVRQAKLPTHKPVVRNSSLLLARGEFQPDAAKMAAPSPARLAALEQERERAVSAYKQLRMDKINSKTSHS